MKTAEGLFHVKLPQIRGREEPYRSVLWGQRATTSDVLKRLILEMYVGGMSQRDIEYSLVPRAVITQRVALGVAGRTSRTVSF